MRHCTTESIRHVRADLLGRGQPHDRVKMYEYDKMKYLEKKCNLAVIPTEDTCYDSSGYEYHQPDSIISRTYYKQNPSAVPVHQPNRSTINGNQYLFSLEM